MTGAEQLKTWRASRKLSMGRAASMVGTDWGAWRAWERGERTPRIDTLVRIKEITGIAVEAWTKPDAPALAATGTRG